MAENKIDYGKIVGLSQSNVERDNELAKAFASLATGHPTLLLEWFPPHQVLRCPACSEEAGWVDVRTYLCDNCEKSVKGEELAVWLQLVRPNLRIKHLYLEESPLTQEKMKVVDSTGAELKRVNRYGPAKYGRA